MEHIDRLVFLCTPRIVELRNQIQRIENKRTYIISDWRFGYYLHESVYIRSTLPLKEAIDKYWENRANHNEMFYRIYKDYFELDALDLKLEWLRDVPDAKFRVQVGGDFYGRSFSR